jgi:PAS domain S-box-containing protein
MVDSENLKEDKLRKKAEEIDKNSFYPIDDLSKDELIRELRVHQMELELQNEELRESQIKLFDSQNKYFELYNFASVGYFTLDKNGLILDVNLTGARMLCVQRRELINCAFIRCIEHDYLNEFHHHINKFLETETKHTTELKLLKKNDNSFYAYLETINILDENGNFKESRITITDITGLKNTEMELEDYRNIFEEKVKKRTEKLNKSLEELRTTETLLSEVTDLSSDVIYVKDRQSRWIFANPALERIIGRTADELLGKTDLEIFSNSEIGKTILEADNKIMDSGKEEILEEIVETPDGMHSFISVKTPRFNENGEVIGIVGISHDITERKKTEETLLESEKNYRELVDNSLVGVYKTNLHGDVLFVNEAIAHILQFDSVDELKEKNIIEIYKNSEDRLQFINKLQKEGHVTDYELKTVGKNAQTVNVLVSASLGDDVISGMFMDITDRKRSEKKFKALINNSTDLIRILDINGRIIFDSPSSERILGYPEGSLVGKSRMEYIHPEDLEKVKHDLDEVYENRNMGVPTEFRIQKSDGNYITVESVSQNMLHVPDIGGVVVTTHPIQQRKEMEDSLRESEKKYRTLFESNPDYTILIGWDGVILDFNLAAEQIIGISKEELVGKHFMELEIFPEDEFGLLEEKFSHLLKHEYVAPFESRIFDKNGDIRLGKTSLTVIKNDNMPAYIFVIFSDITERKQAENKITQSLQEKEVLLREIHHRVKNNMQIISSLLNLQINFEGLDKSVGVLKESQGRVKSMAMIHENLYQSDNLTNINFKEYLEKLVSDIFYSYGIKKGSIESVLDIEDININIDTAIPLGLIINELLTNSVKYAFHQGEGTIIIKLRSLQDKIELTISDNGIGIPKDFDIKNTKTLGLQLVNNLTNQIDGNIEVDISNGTEFKITFKELKYKERK